MRSLQIALEQQNKEEDDRHRLEWQRVIVYDIIAKGYRKTERRGLSFDEIQSKYREEAKSVQGIDISRDQLQPLELRRILLELSMQGTIYQTQQETYVIVEGMISPRAGRHYTESQAKYAIIDMLTADSGKYTVLELSQKVLAKHNLTPEEFNVVMTDLLVAKAILIDKNKKVWCVLNPPLTDHPAEK